MVIEYARNYCGSLSLLGKGESIAIIQCVFAFRMYVESLYFHYHGLRKL